MDSKNFIISNLKELYKSHSYLEIKYEFRDNITTHIIEVKPVHCYDKDKEYILKQIDLEEEFEQLFPYEEILFMTENILIQIENPILELGTSLIEQISEEIIGTNSDIELTFDFVEFFSALSSVNINVAPNYYVRCSQTESQNFKSKELDSSNFYICSPPPNSSIVKSKKNNIKKDSEIKQSLFFLLILQHDKK